MTDGAIRRLVKFVKQGGFRLQTRRSMGLVNLLVDLPFNRWICTALGNREYRLHFYGHHTLLEVHVSEECISINTDECRGVFVLRVEDSVQLSLYLLDVSEMDLEWEERMTQACRDDESAFAEWDAWNSEIEQAERNLRTRFQKEKRLCPTADQADAVYTCWENVYKC